MAGTVARYSAKGTRTHHTVEEYTRKRPKLGRATEIGTYKETLQGEIERLSRTTDARA